MRCASAAGARARSCRVTRSVRAAPSVARRAREQIRQRPDHACAVDLRHAGWCADGLGSRRASRGGLSRPGSPGRSRRRVGAGHGGLMIVVTANEYLDARRPEWLDAEMCGHVVYQKILGTVKITDRVIGVILNDRHG